MWPPGLHIPFRDLSSVIPPPMYSTGPNLDPLPFTFSPKALPKLGSDYLNMSFLKAWRFQEENKKK